MDLGKSAAEHGRDIKAGRTDPVALTEAMLEAISTHPDGDTIYARTMPDRAKAEAEAARGRAKAGVLRGPLDGVPISWKDLFDTAGVATESGSRLLAGRIPQRDARVLQNAAAAGLVALGKTHQTELAFSGLGINTRTATPPNRHGRDLAPGGSSSGAAASIAYSLAAAGIGSDTGGSARVPPAWNDLVGLKPAHGALSLEGVVPLCTRFDTVGPIGRTVEDVSLLNAALGATNAPDLTSTTLSGLRLLVLQSDVLPPIDDAPQAAFEGALAKFSAAGADVVEGGVPGLPEAYDIAGALFTIEAYATWGDTIEADPDTMDPRVLARFRAGRDHSGVDFVRAWQRLDRLRADYLAATAGFDAVLLPTTPILPPKVTDLLADDAYFVEKNLQTLRNTRVANLMGLAALTQPTGIPHCGVMTMVPSGGTARLLRIGAAMETTLLS